MSLDSAIRELEAHAKAREQERREVELINRIGNFLEGPVPVRVAAAKEIIAIVREATEEC